MLACLMEPLAWHETRIATSPSIIIYLYNWIHQVRIGVVPLAAITRADEKVKPPRDTPSTISIRGGQSLLKEILNRGDDKEAGGGRRAARPNLPTFPTMVVRLSFVPGDTKDWSLSRRLLSLEITATLNPSDTRRITWIQTGRFNSNRTFKKWHSEKVHAVWNQSWDLCHCLGLWVQKSNKTKTKTNI